MEFTVSGGVRILRPKGDVMTYFGPRAEMSLRRPGRNVYLLKGRGGGIGELGFTSQVKHLVMAQYK